MEKCKYMDMTAVEKCGGPALKIMVLSYPLGADFRYSLCDEHHKHQMNNSDFLERIDSFCNAAANLEWDTKTQMYQ